MNEKVLKCLYDIMFAIEEIDSFFDERPKRFDEYSTDIILKRAVERNLEIIGEAMNRILKEDPEFPIKNAKRIIGLRNQIIHGYAKHFVTPASLPVINTNHLITAASC